MKSKIIVSDFGMKASASFKAVNGFQKGPKRRKNAVSLEGL